ncbi:unnamed protein product [Caenorhabditis auriculariae]|uniref:J domain-containing protein n=1 Tax=Caenorhabditis auriculariae TaxID=2777116 RepID=A0A8S1HKZ2_9PELO|nr:unnamed protein product [Caenorhabditis auriculariae]
MTTDYYAILDVDRHADDAEIKKAYYKMARKYHPDKNSDSEAPRKFQQISAAYFILSDPKKRQEYNQSGTSTFDSSRPSNGQGNFSSSTFNAEKLFEDFVTEFSGKSMFDIDGFDDGFMPNSQKSGGSRTNGSRAY